MAITLEEFGVLLQIQDQTYRLIRNMRNNANGYIARANAGVNPTALGVEMKADATAFKVRLQQLTDIATRNQTLVSNALGFLGITLSQANTLKTNLIATCDHVLAATLTTKQQDIDEATAILASAPNYDGLWP